MTQKNENNTARVCLLLLASTFAILAATALPPSINASTCDDSPCVINVVNERFYAYWGVGNLYYAYVPTATWATDDCSGGSFAEDAGRKPGTTNEPAYLVGWTKAYHNGVSWVTYGGYPGKFFLTQSTPFHAAADVVLKGITRPIREELNALFPNGCPQDNRANPDLGKPCPLKPVD